MRFSNNIKGKITETIACLLLMAKGYKIISKNSHLTAKGFGVGEVDIICRKEKSVVFVEVKYRRNNEEAMNAISEKQQKRISKAAQAFMAKHHNKYADCNIRIDAIIFSPRKLPRHIINAW